VTVEIVAGEIQVTLMVFLKVLLVWVSPFAQLVIARTFVSEEVSVPAVVADTVENVPVMFPLPTFIRKPRKQLVVEHTPAPPGPRRNTEYCVLGRNEFTLLPSMSRIWIEKGDVEQDVAEHPVAQDPWLGVFVHVSTPVEYAEIPRIPVKNVRSRICILSLDLSKLVIVISKHLHESSIDCACLLMCVL